MPVLPQFRVTQAQVQLSATHPIHVQRTTTRRVPPHDHDYYEIAIVSAGNALHRTDAGETPLRAGSVVIVSPGQVHAFGAGRNFHLTNIYHLAEWLLSDLRTLKEPDGLIPLFLGSRLFPGSDPAPVIEMDLDPAALADCLYELKGIESELLAEFPSPVFLKAMFLKLLVILSRAFTRTRGRPASFQFRREVWMALESIEHVLETVQPFCLAEIARRIGLSATHVTRLFRQETGRSPQEYFQNRRIQRACIRLLNPDQTITEIAHALGYSDAAHFCRIFTRHQKCSPRAYRQRYGVC